MTGMFLALLGGKVTITDQFFEYTTLLLPGNGTNAAQNNTFLDSSTANSGTGWPITRNPLTGPNAPTQGTFSPFSQTGWGNYFSSSGLTAPSNAAFAFGTGQFTFETWFYSTGSNSSDQLFYDLGSVNTSGSFGIFTSLGVLTVRIDGYTNDLTYSLTSSWPNQWHHLAVVRDSSNVLTVYLDGASIASGTRAQNITQNSPYIAKGTGVLSGYAFSGYLSNTRVVKGVAVYTGAFTPPTSPLAATQSAGTNISAITTGQTSLLTCQSNRFIDNGQGNTSNTPFTLTPSGSPTVVAFSPFNPTASWSAATYGGSGYFDGSSDFLSFANNTALQLSNSTAYTIEALVYLNSLTADGGTAGPLILDCYNQSSPFQGYALGVGVGTVGSGNFEFWDGTAWNVMGAASVSQWLHVAISYEGSGTTRRFFINGKLQGSASTQPSTINYTSAATFRVGGRSGSNGVNGYISNLRIVKGTAVYTADFTPPTAPLTAITNTSLLLNFTNAGIYDATSKNDLETVGNAQISTAQSKWGGSSMAFDGNGDGLYRPNTDLFNFGTGNFTIEFWLYYSSKTGYQTIASLGYSPQVSTGWLIQTGNGDGKVNFYVQSAGTVIASDTGSTVNTGQWYHIAIVRNSGTTTIYRDGTSVGSGSDSTNYSSTGVFYIGGGTNTGFNGGYFNGYIQDFRITKGYARYTANFTAPTAAFPTL